MTDCFVTGGTGFIGSHIVRLLAEKGHNVTILARSGSKNELLNGIKYSVVTGDLTHSESIKTAVPKDTEWLFHNAAVMADWGGPTHFYPVNVEGTRNVLEAMREKDIPSLIYTSSTAVYGFPNIKQPLTEDSPWKPMNTYQRSKTLAEQLVIDYESTYGFKVVRIRPPTVVGKGDLFTGPQIIDLLKKGQMVTFGGGKNMQSYAHGEDVAKMIVLAAEKLQVAAGNAFNAVSFTVAFREFIDAIAQKLGVDTKYRNFPYLPTMLLGKILAGLYRAFHIHRAPMLTDFRAMLFGTEYIISNEKAVNGLGYTPKWNLSDTADDMVEWGGYVKPR